MWGLNYQLPKSNHDDDFWARTSQMFVMGCLAIICSGFVAFFAIPLLCILVFYYLPCCLIRGVKNRWNLFSVGRIYDESFFIDGWLCFFAWIILGAAIGRIAGPETAVAGSFCLAVVGGLLEMIYYAVEHMQLPPMEVPRQGVWTGCYDYGNCKSIIIRKNNNWDWAGYKREQGPKEDLLFPTMSQT